MHLVQLGVLGVHLPVQWAMHYPKGGKNVTLSKNCFSSGLIFCHFSRALVTIPFKLMPPSNCSCLRKWLMKKPLDAGQAISFQTAFSMLFVLLHLPILRNSLLIQNSGKDVGDVEDVCLVGSSSSWEKKLSPRKL